MAWQPRQVNPAAACTLWLNGIGCVGAAFGGITAGIVAGVDVCAQAVAATSQIAHANGFPIIKAS